MNAKQTTTQTTEAPNGEGKLGPVELKERKPRHIYPNSKPLAYCGAPRIGTERPWNGVINESHCRECVAVIRFLERM